MSIFNPVTGAKPGVLVASNTITANFGNATPVSITVNTAGVSLWKNGSNVGLSTTLNDGDTLFIRAQSSSNYISASHTTILIGTTYHTFTIVTRQAPETQVYAPFVDVLPVNLPNQQDGSPYVPNLVTNYVAEMDSTGAVTSTVGIPASSSTVGSTNDTIVVANYFSDSISIVDATTKAVVGTITLPAGSKPHSVTYTYLSDADRRSVAWVTLSGTNQVVLIGPDRTILGTYATGVKPMGISASYNGRYIYVANNGSGTVTQFKRNRTTDVWAIATFAAAAGVLDVATDIIGRAWMVCATGSTYYRVDKFGIRSSFTLGTGSVGHRSITLSPDGKFLYLAVSRGPTVFKINVLTGAFVSGASLNSSIMIMPYSVTVTPDNTVYVTCFVTKNVAKINGTTMALVDTYDTTNAGNYPYGVTATPTNNVWLANYYDNTPDYNLRLDQTPDQFAFLPHSAQDLDTTYETEAITVTGLPNATPVSIPGIFGAQILKNGTPVAFNTTVVTGDTLAIRYHTPNAFDVPIEIPMFIGNVSAALVSSTTAAPSKPDDVTFDVIFVKAPVSNQESSEATISGLGETTTSKITLSDTDHWHFRLNGVEMLDEDGEPLKIITVKNGDVFTIIGVADLNLGEDAIVEVQAVIGPNRVSFGHLDVQVPTIHNGMYWVHISAQYVEDAFLVGMLDESNNNARTVDMPVATYGVGTEQRTVVMPIAMVAPSPTKATAAAVVPMVAIKAKSTTAAVNGYDIALPVKTVRSDAPKYVMAPERAIHMTSVARYAPKMDFTQLLAPVPGYSNELEAAVHFITPPPPEYVKSPEWTMRDVAPKYVKEADYPLRKYVPLFHKYKQGSLRDVAPTYVKDVHVVQLYPDDLPKYDVVGTVVQPTTVPVFFVVQPPAIRTIPGQNSEDYTHEVAPVRRLAPVNRYVSVGTPNEPRTPAITGFIKRESSLQRLSDPMVYDRLVPNRNLSEEAQFEKTYYVHQVEFADTFAQQGLYNTYEDAIAAGEAEGHSLVNAKLMPTGGWMWNYSIPLPINGCFNEVDPEPPVGIPMPTRWYVHGG